jgi:hypothetical protein
VAEPVFTASRGEQHKALTMRRDFPSPTDSRHLVLEAIEVAGIRVAEQRFAAKDMIFALVVPDVKIGTIAQQPCAAV